MKFTTAFFAFISLVVALPTPDGDLGTRQQGNVFVCVDAGFQNGCTTLQGSSAQCVNVPGVFNDNISSVGPDSAQDCFFFTSVFLPPILIVMSDVACMVNTAMQTVVEAALDLSAAPVSQILLELGSTMRSRRSSASSDEEHYAPSSCH
ncbi:hypothetical protein C8R43DRAFT_1230977 [Mycena crocata]|nr:hypothetical protein C8R43DRAFT_1230977 [Mycena crocata]